MKTITSTTEIKKLIQQFNESIKIKAKFRYELENKKGELTNTDIEIIGIYTGEILTLENVIQELKNILNK